MEPYDLAKFLHVLSSTVLFGTGIGTAFQMARAMARGTAEAVHSTASAVVLADWLFTTPAGLIQPATGLWLVHLTGHPLTAPWLVAAFGLYLLAFLCWAPVVVLQLRIRDLASRALHDGQPLPARVWRLYRLWFVLGWPAFAALVAIFWLMIAKPPILF
jgi:uncharacterized membrane protein